MISISFFLTFLSFWGGFFQEDKPAGPTVFAVFVGRTPCEAISKNLDLPVTSDCFKLKWKVTLYQDASTKTPGNYKIEATFCRQKARTGSWKIVKGDESYPVIYELDFDGKPLRFYLADDVLFFLNPDGGLLQGDSQFSYTLNKKPEAI